MQRNNFAETATLPGERATAARDIAACLRRQPGGKLAGLCCREEIMTEPVGLARGLTNYGDPDFALYLRRSFARSMGYSTELLARPVIGIADTLFRLQQLPPPFPGADRRGQARRPGGGRAAVDLPDDLIGRSVPVARPA